MRERLIALIYDLAEETGDTIVEDLRNWSNQDLIEYYGTLRVEEYWQAKERYESQREA